MLDLLKYRYFYLLLSGLIILPGLIFIALGGLKPGIDFQGGTQITVVMPKGANPTTAAVVSVVRTVTYTNSAGKKVLFDDVEAQGVTDPAYKGQQEFLIRVPDIGSDVVAQQNLLSALKKQWGDVKQVSLDSVSGTVGADTTNRAIQAVIAAAVAILLYMASPSASCRTPSSTAAPPLPRCCTTSWWCWASSPSWATSSTCASMRSSCRLC